MSKVKEIRLTNLSIGYRKKLPVVKDITAVIPYRQLVGLIGDNGSGKSTLLRTFIRELTPLSGEIIVGDESIFTYSSEEFSTKVSVVFTGRQVTMGLDVKTVIAMGRYPYQGYFGTTSPRDQAHISKMVSLMKIDKLLDKRMEEISDGEYQKVMIARALVQDTPVLLLDEPLAFLDHTSKVNLLNTLKYLTEHTGKLIIFSSHDLALLAPVVDGLIVLQEQEFKYINEGVTPFLSQVMAPRE